MLNPGSPAMHGASGFFTSGGGWSQGVAMMTVPRQLLSERSDRPLLFTNTKRPHSALGYRPPAPVTYSPIPVPLEQSQNMQ